MNEPGTRALGIAAPPGTMVRCPLKGGAEIGAGRCVEWQGEIGCHCENALVSLGLVEEHLREQPHQEEFPHRVERNRKLDQIRELRARAKELAKAKPAPMPAKPKEERPMPRGYKLSPCDKCGGQVGTRQPGQTCKTCAPPQKPKAKAGSDQSAHRAQRKQARAAADKRNGGGQSVPPEAISGDVVSILKAKLAEHQAQAEKIEKALEVLS